VYRERLTFENLFLTVTEAGLRLDKTACRYPTIPTIEVTIPHCTLPP